MDLTILNSVYRDPKKITLTLNPSKTSCVVYGFHCREYGLRGIL